MCSKSRASLVVAAVIAAGVVILHADTQLASDDFNRADESPLASPWIAPDGVADSKFLLSSNLVQGKTQTTFQLMYYTGPSWTDSQYAQATLGGSALNLSYGGVAVEISNSAQTAYWYGDVLGAYKIQKIVSGSVTNLANCTGTPTATDILKLTVVSDSLTGTVNGGSTCTVSGGASLSGGAAGMWGYGATGVYTLDTWSGGTVAAGGATCTGGLALLGVGGCH